MCLCWCIEYLGVALHYRNLQAHWQTKWHDQHAVARTSLLRSFRSFARNVEFAIYTLGRSSDIVPNHLCCPFQPVRTSARQENFSLRRTVRIWPIITIQCKTFYQMHARMQLGTSSTVRQKASRFPLAGRHQPAYACFGNLRLTCHSAKLVCLAIEFFPSAVLIAAAVAACCSLARQQPILVQQHMRTALMKASASQ